jgi:hypothetical protein
MCGLTFLEEKKTDPLVQLRTVTRDGYEIVMFTLKFCDWRRNTGFFECGEQEHGFGGIVPTRIVDQIANRLVQLDRLNDFSGVRLLSISFVTGAKPQAVPLWRTLWESLMSPQRGRNSSPINAIPSGVNNPAL